MLSGQQPFPGANVTSILYKLVHVDPVEPADLEMNGLVPQKWREVFHKVLAKKPESRYQTASAFVQDLEYCLGLLVHRPRERGDGQPAGAGSRREDAGDPADAGGARRARPSRSAAAPVAAEEAETLVLVGPALAGPDDDAEVPATLVLEAGSAPSDGEATILLAAAPTTEDVVPATVVMAPPTASRTLPPEPTLREAAPPPERLRRVGPVARACRSGGLSAGAARRPGARHRRLGPLAALAGGAAPAAPSPSRRPPRHPGRRSAAPPLGPTRQPRRAGVLRIESEPSGARVSVNGQAKGQTPLRLAELPFGSYQVRVEQKGYDAQTREVTLRAGSAAGVLQFALVRAAAAGPGGRRRRVDAAGSLGLGGRASASGRRRSPV